MMRVFILFILVTLFTSAAISSQAFAQQETNFLITVKARDAKFIGTSMGGAHVVIRNRLTGDIIANGNTYGKTGDTETIMGADQGRDSVLVDANTAKWEFSLEFWEPTPVTISATAPLANGQGKVSVSEDMILIPGKDYASGNGIMLEVPGFSVDINKPLANSTKKIDENEPLMIEANIMKLCGCKISADSPWPPERYQVEAHVYKDGLYISSVEMNHTGKPGIYRSKLQIPIAGTYKISVTAFDSHTKEAGMDTSTITLSE